MEKPEKKKEYINLLLLLQDRRGDQPLNTEGIALMSYNSTAGSIKVVFLLPEMYVKVSGGGRALYSVYALGGLEILKKTVEENFGIYLDGCFEADSEGVRKIVDAAGGLDVNLTAAEAEALKKSAGANKLDGAAALEYTRIPGTASPFDKTLRQRKALAQYVTKISAFGKSEKLKLLNDMLPSLATDMSKEKMMGCIFEFAKISGGRVDGGSLIIPDSGAYKSIEINKNTFLLPDFAANRALLKKWVYGT
jgi:LCP family protein required for cell wall assembly